MNDNWHFIETSKFLKKLPTKIWGLSFFPSFEPIISDDQDMPYDHWLECDEISECNRMVIENLLKELGPKCQTIVEIGVNRNGERSISQILINDRPSGSFYLGVDINDKSELNDPDKNTWTIKANSHNQGAVRAFLYDHTIKEIDLLFIDGWHSVNTTVNDWQYADMLSEHGIVAIHDQNTHPGDIGLYHAVDSTMFDKSRYCIGFDSGIGVFRRKSKFDMILGNLDTLLQI